MNPKREGQFKMKVFDIKQSIISPLNKLTNENVGRTNFGTPVYQTFMREPSCGVTDFNNLRNVLEASNQKLDNAVRDLASMLAFADQAIGDAFTALGAIANVADKLSSLYDTLAEVNILDKVSDLVMDAVDLGVGLAKAAVTKVKKAFSDLGNAITDMKDKAIAGLSKFATNVMDALKKTWDNFDISIDIGDPIANLAKALVCAAPNLLGALALGLSSALGASSALASSPLGGALGAVKTGLAVAQTGANIYSNVSRMSSGQLVSAGIAAVNPQLGQYASRFGVTGLIDTAFGNQAKGSYSNNTVEACRLAQQLNRYNTFDPFITEALSSDVYTRRVLQQQADAASSTAYECKCCAKKDRYERLTKFADMNSSHYDSTTAYRNASGLSSFSSTPVDTISATIQGYGFENNSAMTSNLAVNLEMLRLSMELEKNFSEVSEDPLKLEDFGQKTKLTTNYLTDLQTVTLNENLALADDMQDKIYEISV